MRKKKPLRIITTHSIVHIVLMYPRFPQPKPGGWEVSVGAAGVDNSALDLLAQLAFHIPLQIGQ